MCCIFFICTDVKKNAKNVTPFPEREGILGKEIRDDFI